MIYAILMEPGMTLQAQKNFKSLQDFLIFQLFWLFMWNTVILTVYQI